MGRQNCARVRERALQRGQFFFYRNEIYKQARVGISSRAIHLLSM